MSYTWTYRLAPTASVVSASSLLVMVNPTYPDGSVETAPGPREYALVEIVAAWGMSLVCGAAPGAESAGGAGGPGPGPRGYALVEIVADWGMSLVSDAAPGSELADGIRNVMDSIVC